MPLYGVGFNGHQQVMACTECSLFEPVMLHVDPTRKIKNVTILWSRIFILMEDCSILMLHKLKDNSKASMDHRPNANVINDSFNLMSGCFPHAITYNFIDKKLLLWDSDFVNSKMLSCDKLKNVNFSLDEIHSAEDNKTLIFVTNSGTLFKSISSPGDIGEDHAIDIEQLYILPNISLPVKVKQVSCGNHHTLVLTSIGLVFSFGIGNQGQLGIGSIESRESPTIIEQLEGMFVLRVSAGGWHSMALTDSGDIYAWGWNNYGQLGLPLHNRADAESVTIQTHPTCLDIPISLENNKSADGNEKDDQEFMSFIEIACGSRHSLAINSVGDVYSWGWNKYGQLGYRSEEVNCNPRKVKMSHSEKVVRIFAGYWNSLFEVSSTDR